MSWKFNPPPGWPPQPPGWQPPPGWAPDPTWPAAPPNWQFWVSADTTPTFQAPAPSPFTGAPTAQSPFSGAPAAPYQPAAFGGSYPPVGYPGVPAPKPWFQQGWVIGAAVAAVVLLLAGLVGVGTFVLLRTDDPGTSAGPSELTPGPTPSASAAATPEPGAAPVGADAQAYEGEGSDVVALDLVDGEPYTVAITHTGDGWFEAWATLDGRDVTSLGWSYGDFAGTRALGLYPDEEADAIRVEATGSWTVAVRPLADSPSWPGQGDGTGSMVLLVDPGEEQAVTGTHAGESNFIVWAYVEGSYPELLFNEIGDYSGSAVLPTDTYAVSIEADGDWTIEEK